MLSQVSSSCRAAGAEVQLLLASGGGGGASGSAPVQDMWPVPTVQGLGDVCGHHPRKQGLQLRVVGAVSHHGGKVSGVGPVGGEGVI
jgi:hypothetical protein